MKDLSRAVILFFLFIPLFIQAISPPKGDENKILIFTFASSGSSVIEKVDINSAPLEDLVKIIHIGEVRAKELISLRPFSSLDDLDRIKGISKTRVEDIKKQGLAWVEIEEQIEAEKEVEVDELRSSPPFANARVNDLEEKKKLATINEQMSEKPSLFPLLVAFPIAIFSGIIILFLKRKVKIYNKNV